MYELVFFDSVFLSFYVASKDGAGIKMSGYPEDGMSIGVGVGQLAPWMMPPDDYQAPNSQQMMHKQQEPQMGGQQPQLHYQQHNDIINRQRFPQQMLQEQQHQAHLQQMQQHAIQQRYLAKGSQMMNSFTPGPENRSDMHTMNQYNNMTTSIDYRNFQTPSSSMQRNSMEFMNSLDGFPPSSQSSMGMYPTPTSAGGYSWSTPYSEWNPNGGASESQIAFDSHGPSVSYSIHHRQMGSAPQILEDVNGKLGAHYNVQNLTNTSMNNASMAIPPQYQGKERGAVMNNASNRIRNSLEENSKTLEPTSGSGKKMPRNTSVDNFWMLVDMGDLPQPENDVLQETLFTRDNSQDSSVEASARNVKTENGTIHQNSSNFTHMSNNPLNGMDNDRQQHYQRQQYQFVSGANDSSSDSNAINNSADLMLNSVNSINKYSMATSAIPSRPSSAPTLEADVKMEPLVSVDHVITTTNRGSASSTNQPAEAPVESGVEVKGSSDTIESKCSNEDTETIENNIGEKRKISAVANE